MKYLQRRINMAVDAFIWGFMTSAALYLTGVRFLGVVLSAE